MTNRTSISDLEWYRNECQLAANDPAAFSSFRRNPVLTQIWEHVSYDLGQQYLDLIDLDRYHPKHFAQNDTIGGADTHYYPKIDMAVSPSTLRYIHVLQELDKRFDLSTIESIAEIGGGYGGQAAVIQEYIGNPLYAYHIFDLPEVQKLAGKFLYKLGFIRVYYCGADSFDLTFSNYAFSELSEQTQQQYFDDVIVNSKNVYMVYNHISEQFGIKSWSVAEFGRRLMQAGFTVSIEDETPKTHARNFVVVATK
jgi:hypothetical protein